MGCFGRDEGAEGTRMRAGGRVTERAARPASDRHEHDGRSTASKSFPQTTTILIAHTPSRSNMPVAPITGTLRRNFFLNLSAALGLGTAAGYTYWYV